MTDSSDRNAITEHFVRAEAKFLTERMKLTIEKGGQPPPFALVICRRNVVDGTPLDATCCELPVLFRGAFSEESFEDFMGHARGAAIAGDAFASILCVQRWAVLDEDIAADVDVTEHPRRVEVLTTLIEWADDRPCDQLVVAFERDQGFVDFDDVTARVRWLDLRLGNRVLTPDVASTPPDILECARRLAHSALHRYHEWVARSTAHHHAGPAGQS